MVKLILDRDRPIFDMLVNHYIKNPGLPHDEILLYSKFGQGEKFGGFLNGLRGTVAAAKREAAKRLGRIWDNDAKLQKKYTREMYTNLYPAVEYLGPPRPRRTPKGTAYLPYVPKCRSVHYRTMCMDAVHQFLIDHPGERIPTARFAALAGVDPYDKLRMRSLHVSLDQIAKQLAKHRPELVAVRKRGGPRFGPRLRAHK